MLYVGTGLNPGYYPKAKMFGYFDTVAQFMPPLAKPFAVLLDYDEREVAQFKACNPTFKIVRMTSQQVEAANPNKCMQHGVFLGETVRQLELNEDDYVIYTDADMRAQRSFTQEEVDQFKLKGVLVGTNWHDGETLAEEMPALGPQVSSFAEMRRIFPGIGSLFCFNTGLLGMTVSDWQKLFTEYKRMWPVVSLRFQHYAKQQWLISYLLQTKDFYLIPHTSELTRDVHVHGHNPCTDIRLANSGVTKQDSVYVRNGRPVVFAHNLPR
jgi:hypothetical protein